MPSCTAQHRLNAWCKAFAMHTLLAALACFVPASLLLLFQHLCLPIATHPEQAMAASRVLEHACCAVLHLQGGVAIARAACAPSAEARLKLQLEVECTDQLVLCDVLGQLCKVRDWRPCLGCCCMTPACLPLLAMALQV